MSEEREEIERIKKEMRRGELMKRAVEAINAWSGSAEHRRMARAELDAESLDLTATQQPAATPASTDEYLGLDELEAERRELARRGRPHGIDALAKILGKNARTTIRKRYRDLGPPGAPILGICDSAPRHQHFGPKGS